MFMHSVFKITFLITLFVSAPSMGKILIITHACNRPDFIEIQYKTFKKFLLNEYTFVVFNDAIDQEVYQGIDSICKKYAIPCYAIPQHIHTRPYLHRPEVGTYSNPQKASARNCTVVQYSLDILGFEHDDIVVIIDSDLFLVRPFNLEAYMEGHQVATFYRSCCDLGMECGYKHPGLPEMKFFWIGLTFLDMKQLKRKEAINFNCGTIDTIDMDAGGHTYYYAQGTSELKVQSINRHRHLELICKYCTYHQRPTCKHNAHTLERIGFTERQIKLIQELPLAYNYHWNRNVEFFLDGTFVHYRCGSNYTDMPPEYIEKKNKVLNWYIQDILKGSP